MPTTDDRSDGRPQAGAASAETSVPEPIAVIGAGCRLAGGADSPGAFWDLLLSGRDGIGEMPEDRWAGYRSLGPEHGAVVRRADIPCGFLEDVEGFDASFFGLTPREAELMDPQQRLLLEVVWEALEHAGLPPQDLAGGDTGVFIGIGSDDYGRRLLEDLPKIEAWTGIGSAMCAAANRVSYALDLHGPSVAIDTACSASLVATHMACQSLRARESGIALVGGVNLIISPGLSLTLESAGATAPDGRCKPFDASANGYGRGEGGAVLVLKRLSDAQRDGDRVLAVVRGSHISQDGRTNGIMAPSGTAQQQLLEETLRRSGVPASSVDYVEAHGTGTRLGDPLEAGALGAVYGSGRPADEPVLLGSVKPNIGHLEAGAGVASLLKATLALAHGEIPPSLNYTEGNPAIDWENNGLRVVTERTSWPERGRPRRAGVSGFGYGGTIAHVVLEQAPEPARPAGAAAGAEERRTGEEEQRAPALFPVSAKSPAALREYAGRMADWLTEDGTSASLESLGHTLALRRSHLEHRAAVTADDREDLAAKLRIVAGGEQTREAVLGSAPAGPGKGLVWVFSGHGSQWTGMGRELLAAEPVFAEVIDELGPVFQEEIGFTPRQVLLDGDFETVDRVQTMIFAVQLGLAEVWRSYGVEPDAVIGHSVGELAAAVTCGALSRTDGARLICRRSRLLRRVQGQGAMAMAALSLEETTERLAGRTDVVAAISASPSSTVISGDPGAVEAVVEEWQSEGVQLRRVASDVAFHSPQMDPLLDELAAAADDLATGTPRVPMYSTALSDPRTVPAADGSYWAANLRNTVRLASATRAAAEDGYRAFLEISAHPVVAHSIGETLAEEGVEDAFVGSSLRRDQSEPHMLLAALGAVHAHGVPVDWARLQPSGELVSLPPVAWQRQRHWRDTDFPGAGQGLQHDVDSHTLLGPAVAVSGRPMRLWRTMLEDANKPYPGSHTINGTEIVPAAVLLSTFLAAAFDGEGDGRAGGSLSEVALRLPLTVSERRELQVVHDETGLQISSRLPVDGGGPGGTDASWLLHTTATAGCADGAAVLPGKLPAPPSALSPADPEEIVKHLASVGVPTMGFEWEVEELLRGEGTLHARVRVEQPERAPATWAPVLDAALSVAPSAYPGPATLRMVAALAAVRVDGEPVEVADIRVTHDASADAVDVLVADADGRVLLALEGVRYGTVGQSTVTAAPARDLVHETAWRPWEAGGDGASRTVANVVLVGDTEGPLAEALRKQLAADGAGFRTAEGPAGLDDLSGLGEGTDVLLLPPPPPPGVSVPDASARAASLLLETAQLLAQRQESVFPRLWLLTGGVRECREPASLAHSSLWGLGRVIAGEHGELWGGIVDLPAKAGVRSARLLLDVLKAAPREDVLCVRDGAVSAARLARTEREATGGPVACRPDGTYVVTGGLGVLGLEVAQWLAGRGARRLVLAGRGGLPPRSEWDTVTDGRLLRHIAGVRALEAAGVTVKAVALDVADGEAAARVLDPDALGMPPVRGIVHAAGVLDNKLVPQTDEKSLRYVMRPKAEGAWVLHEQFPPGSLDFFVLFSSCGQHLGLPGQAAYGSANAFLDGLALHRNAVAAASGRTGDATSFAWTSWRGQGMAVNEVVDMELRERGVTDISLPEAFAAWDHAARRGTGCFPVLRTVALEAGAERLPLLRETGTQDEAAADAPQEAVSYGGLTPEELHERLLGEVTEQIAGEMRLPTASLDVRRSLVEQGLDSVMTIVIRRRLEKRFGRKLPATLLWHQPTVHAISGHLAELLAPSEEPQDGELAPA